MESKEAFTNRCMPWWKSHYNKEKTTRESHYNSFLKRHSIETNANMIIAEVGAGPFGGIIEVCKLQAKQKVFIDYIMNELRGLEFIEWPDDAMYINSPAENINLPDDYADLLISYNCIDHGWDIEKAIKECIRVSKKTVLSFDCRADWIDWKPDESHYQYLYSQNIESLIHKMSLDVRILKRHMEHQYKSSVIELICDKEA